MHLVRATTTSSCAKMWRRATLLTGNLNWPFMTTPNEMTKFNAVPLKIGKYFHIHPQFLDCHVTWPGSATVDDHFQFQIYSRRLCWECRVGTNVIKRVKLRYVTAVCLPFHSHTRELTVGNLQFACDSESFDEVILVVTAICFITIDLIECYSLTVVQCRMLVASG